MTNLERYQSLQNVDGEYILALNDMNHLDETHVKGSIISPITWADFEQHRFTRFTLDDGISQVVCHCRPELFPEDYDAHSFFGVEAILSRTDEESLFCYSIERRDPVA